MDQEGPGVKQEQPDALPGFKGRFVFPATLALAMSAGPFSIYAIGALAPLLTDDLGITRAQLGTITTVVVVIAAVLVPFVGRVVDDFGGRRMCLVLFGLAITSLVGTAAAPDYGWLLAMMAISGFALSMIEPSTNRLISSHVPRDHQGLLIGIKQSGVQAGALLAGAALPAGGVLIGWRGVLLASAFLPLAGLVGVMTAVPRDPVRGQDIASAQPPPRLAAAVPWLAGYAFFMGAGVSPVSTYLPLYAHEEIGLSVTAAGMAAAVVAGVGIVARIVWGHQAARLGYAPIPLTVLAALSVASQVAIWTAQGGGSWLLWTGAALFGASAGAWNAVVMLAVVREVDVRLAGRASGLVQSSFYFGFLASPIAFGASVDVTGAYHTGWAAMTAVFAFAGVIALVWHHRSRALDPATRA